MKRLPLVRPEAGPPSHWRSLDHLAQKPEVKETIEREFPDGADSSESLDGPSRRTFLTLMSASFALMGVAGCVRRPEEKIIPYSKMPEHVIPGIPQHYASALSYQGEAIGVLVESHEGRPTKIEGNPDHPGSFGGTMAYQQAVLLDLYDPDRVQAPRKGSDGINPDATAVDPSQPIAELSSRLDALEKRDGGSGLRVLLEPTSSPSVARLKKEIAARFPKAKIYEYSSVSLANANAGTKLALGATHRVHVRYDMARVVVSADADFLGTEPNAIVATKGWARARRVHKPTDRGSRLYVAEPALSVTGMNADHRVKVPASQIEEFLLSLGAELAKKGVQFGALQGRLRASASLDAKAIGAIADDLAKNRGASAIVVGTRQPAAVHALALALNEGLGNFGKTVRFTRPADEPTDGVAQLKALADELTGGKVDTLVVLGGNPVYAAPGDIDFAKAMQAAQFRFHLAHQLDETASSATWVFPRAHELESWGDLRAPDGTYTVQQPLIAPLFNGKSDLEILALVAKSHDTRGHDIIRATFKTLNEAPTPAHTDDHGATAAASASAAASAAPAASGSASAAPAASGSAPAASASASASASAPAASASALASAAASGSAAPAATGSVGAPPPNPHAPAPFPEKLWRRSLHDGFVRAPGAPFVDAKVALDQVAAAVGKKPAVQLSAQALEVTFAPDYGLFDGRYSNVAWLQELPNPVTKTVWDNAAWISPKLAQELSLTSGDVIKLTVGGRNVDIPVWVVPGTADYSVQLHLGWGRKMLGRVATPEGELRGFNVGPLRSVADMGFATSATIAKGGAALNHYEIVVTQEHQMVEGRPIALDGTLEEFRKDPKFADHKKIHHPPLVSLWPDQQYLNHKWGMVIDLTTCTGCSSCVIACQAENNIPTVGKLQVARQREMHWLRIDRYFSGNPENPITVNQPMACVHCENAPCENVCPVAATSHSPEGLNEMTYNRCIGTRYCSNNCPYKTRRFNFLDFRADVPETVKMVHNPNVSVRMRGVMEKCTYCVQRIQSAKIAAKRENRKLRDGDIKVACQQACPADAIVFGDLNDRGSKVTELTALDHTFGVLEEINTKPRTVYTAKIRNPNPELA